ncbi:MAG TPA: hypothetical protein DDW81_09625 [Cryomorphaceae bacterium]|nr:hypothetical protein [Owenweeksia sp.]HBF20347.1 hypothetical protein [Cryomorphaceae bacterium]HCQ15618.1 hypothetical protein [Cryomorphaceae bacterium]|tara:strand:+ start:3293 stop:3562 length:270 start_codon:yes stop_codon:yes gene_type:complete
MQKFRYSFFRPSNSGTPKYSYHKRQLHKTFYMVSWLMVLGSLVLLTATYGKVFLREVLTSVIIIAGLVLLKKLDQPELPGDSIKTNDLH